MSYIIVNEELGIQTCNIDDLEKEYDDAAATITMIYNPITNMITLNGDNKDYELYKVMAETFLLVDAEKRCMLKEKSKEITKHSFDETFNLLEAVIRNRASRKKVSHE